MGPVRRVGLYTKVAGGVTLLGIVDAHTTRRAATELSEMAAELQRHVASFRY